MSEMDDILDIEHFFKTKRASKEVKDAFQRLLDTQNEKDKELIIYRKFYGSCTRLIKTAKMLENIAETTFEEVYRL